MRILIVILLSLTLVFSSAFAVGGKSSHSAVVFNDSYHLNNADIDIEDGTIIITHKGRRQTTVEITENYELFIDERPVKMNAERKMLVKQYYILVIDIHERAVEIGIEGARIGLDGAKIGAKAIKNVLKMFLTEYDSDDLEREMEKEASAIEARAEELEEQADEIEEMAEELEEIAEELEEQIPELEDLIWF